MAFAAPVRHIAVIAFICMAFLTVIVILNHWNSVRAELTLRDKNIEHTTFLNQVVELKGNSLKSVAIDFARWDEMAKFTQTADTQWVRNNIDGSMPVYYVDAAWALTADFRSLYSYSRSNSPELLRELPGLGQVKSEVSRNPYLHYYAFSKRGLLEIRGAPICWQKSASCSPPLGYFFVGRLWDQGYLDGLSLLTGSELTLERAEGVESVSPPDHGQGVLVRKTLSGPDGTAVAFLTGRVNVGFLGEMEILSRREAVVLIGFAVALMLILVLSHWNWVSRPLATIAKSLETQDQNVLHRLERHSSEFGKIAGMIAGLLSHKGRLELELKDGRQLQSELRRQNASMSQWLDNLAEAVWVMDVNAQFVYVNEATSRMLGYDRDELLGRSIHEMQLPAQASKSREVLSRVMAGATLEAYEGEALRKDGTRCAVTVSAKRLLDSEGNVIGISGSAWDDTRRKQAEVALEQSEERFRTLVSNIPGVVYRCKADEKYTMSYISPEIEKICGAPAEDFIGNRVLSFADIIYPDDCKSVANAVRSAIERHGSFTVEYRILTADGSLRWVHEKGKPIFGTEENVLWLDGVLLDITDRKQVQDMLRELEARNNQILNAISEMVLVSGPDNNIIWANQAVLDFYHISEDRLTELEHDLIGSSYSDVFRLGVTEDVPEETRVRFDGERRVFHTVRSPILNAGGKAVMAVSVSRDITDKALIQDAQLLSERYFRTIVENSSDLVMVLDAEGRIRYHNAVVNSLLGYESHEQALKKLEDFIHSEDREVVREAFAGHEMSAPVRCRIKHKGGWWVMTEMAACSALDPQGMPIIITTSRCVDETVRIEESLRESRSYLQAVFNAVQAGIIIVNAETHHIIDANLVALNLIGSPIEEVLGSAIEKYVMSESGAFLSGDDPDNPDRAKAILTKADGRHMPIMRSVENALLHGHACVVFSFVRSRQESESQTTPSPQSS